MKKFIKKITRGSKLALFLEVLLLCQIVLYTYLYINRPECEEVDHYPGYITTEDEYEN